MGVQPTRLPPVSLPPLELAQVDPSFGYTDEATQVTLLGRRFYPRVAVSSQTGDPIVDDAFRVWLVPPGAPSRAVEFDDVELVSLERISARLPAGVPIGKYDVRLEGPTGRVGVLEEEFTILSTRPVRLDVSPQSQASSYPTGAPVSVDITLRDSTDEILRRSYDILITAIDEFGVPLSDQELVLLDNLENIRPTPDDDGLIATMPDGLASIFVVRNDPGDVQLEVQPWEDEPGVVGDTLRLGFRAVDDFSLIFDPLPAPGPEGGYLAGEAVPVRARAIDAFGRPVTRPVTFTLIAPCSFWVDTITFEGEHPTEFDLVPTKVCDRDQISEATRDVEGISDPFSVVAAEVASFEIFGLQPSPVVAGDPVQIDVLPVDAFGNRTAYAGPLVVTAPDAEPLSAECDPAAGPGLTRRCTLVPTKVGTDLLVEVIDASGTVKGDRADLTVLPRPEPVQAGLSIASATVAGEPFPLSIQPFDPYGNVLDASGFPASS
ncbi:MAG: hypothetical protein AAF602_33460, partial [Myxococcota bacterium]